MNLVIMFVVYLKKYDRIQHEKMMFHKTMINENIFLLSFP